MWEYGIREVSDMMFLTCFMEYIYHSNSNQVTLSNITPVRNHLVVVEQNTKQNKTKTIKKTEQNKKTLENNFARLMIYDDQVLIIFHEDVFDFIRSNAPCVYPLNPTSPCFITVIL